MFKKFRKTIAVSIALTLALGLTAYAQLQQGPRGQKQKAGIAGQQRVLNQRQGMASRQNQGGAGIQGLGGLGLGSKQMNCFAFASLQRILFPPNLRELRNLELILGLTDTQKEQVKTLYKQFIDTAKPVCQERGTAVQGVLTALSQPSPSKGSLQSAANQVFQADKTIVDAEFDFWLGLKSILNPQQQQSMTQFMQQKALGQLGGGRMGGGQNR